jgi:hypothetical protein
VKGLAQRRTVLLVGLTVGIVVTGALHAQTAGAGDPSVRSTEQTLAAVVQWEILWNDSPKGFRLPPNGSFVVAIHAASGSVSYCSHQAGVCVTYRTGDDRNWEGTEQALCDDNRSDLEAVLAFIQKDSVTSVRKEPTTDHTPPATGERGFSGVPAPESDVTPTAGSGVTWTTKIAVGSRVEVVMKYRQMHPPGMADLEKWLRPQLVGDSEPKSITVACFAPTDPMVNYYVDRPTKGPAERPTAAPTVISVFWRLDQPEEWVVAGYSQRWQNPQRFDETRRIVESVACSTLSFK